jgi:hypothetical protein
VANVRQTVFVVKIQISCRRGSAKHCIRDGIHQVYKKNRFSTIGSRAVEPVEIKICTLGEASRSRDLPSLIYRSLERSLHAERQSLDFNWHDFFSNFLGVTGTRRDHIALDAGCRKEAPFGVSSIYLNS